MNGAGIAVGTIGLGMVIIAGIFALKTFGSGGDSVERVEARFMSHLSEAEINAELDRLRGLPGEPKSANVGQIADAIVSCAAEMMTGKPTAKAQEASRRYFTVVHAINERIASPLIDPQVQGYSGDTTTDQAYRSRVANYANTTHPIFTGLDLDANGFARADFEKVVIAESANAKRVKACAARRVGG